MDDHDGAGKMLPLSRRQFLKAGSALGAGLVLGLVMPDMFAATDNIRYTPNLFLRIAPDSSITVIINRLESGQGISTSLAMLIADELGANWSQMHTELAPAADVFKDPQSGMQMTLEQSSLANSYLQYRQIGACARAMLITAAAKQWQVTEAECSTQNSWVIGPLGYKASFASLAQAAMQLELPDAVVLQSPNQFKRIGQATPGLNTQAQVDGSFQYGMDLHLPEMKVALVARAPQFGATLASVDARAALAVPGVLQVVKLNHGVAVIADGFWPAKLGREALLLKWNTSNLTPVDSERQHSAFHELAKTAGTVVRRADISALATAVKKINAEYEFPYLAHTPMEPLNCTAELTAQGCTVWTASQFQTADQLAIARAAGVSLQQVTLHTLAAGGSFGRRAVPTSAHIVEAVQVAKAWQQLGKSGPVKVIWTRDDDIEGGYYRPAVAHRAELGFDAQGNMLAWDHVIVGQSVGLGTPAEKMLVKNGIDQTLTTGLAESYHVPLNLSLHYAQANVPVLWFRATAASHTAFVTETLLDEAAQLTGVDPVAYRRTLLGQDHPHHLAALNLAVRISGYDSKKLPRGRAWGVALHESQNSVVAYVVEASVRKNMPQLHRVWAGVHCHLAVNPLGVEAQVQGAVLMALGMTLPGAAITLKEGVVQQHSFSDYPLARISDMPQVTVALVPSDEPPSGMADAGFPALAPAYANAIARLTGKRLRKLPFNLSQA